MIISIKHRLIFIHVFKTGGTSIEHTLKSLGIGQVNYFCDQDIQCHSSAQNLVDILGKELFDTCFSFAFVRNPWDYCFSMYKYMLKEKSHWQHNEVAKYKNFKHYLKTKYYEHLEAGPSSKMRTQKSFVCDDKSNALVKFIGRFENLNRDFETILQKSGLDARQTTLPHLNKSTNGDFRLNYESVMVDWVSKMYSQDINFFNYTFE